MDGRLVVLAQGGDEEAFAILTESLVDRFHGVVRNILRDPALAEDAIQVALVQGLAGPATAARPGALRGVGIPAAGERLLFRGPPGLAAGCPAS